MRKMDLSLFIGVLVAVLLGSFTGFGAECAEIRENVVRLHVLANSDSPEDQELKYAVRDALLSQSEQLFEEAETRDQAEQRIAEKLQEIEAAAQTEIEARGYRYTAKATLVNMYFDTRQYDGFTVPAGRYDAVRITIGEGKGQNWWCVMFPPMCVPCASEKPELPIQEQIEALGTQPVYKPKFAVVELIERAKQALENEPDVVLAETEPEPRLGPEPYTRFTMNP